MAAKATKKTAPVSRKAPAKAAKKSASAPKSARPKKPVKATPAASKKKSPAKVAATKAPAKATAKIVEAKVPVKKSAAAPVAKTKAHPKEARPAVQARPARVVIPPKKLSELRQVLVDKHRDFVDAYTNTKGDSRMRQSDGTEDYIDYAVSSYDREFLLSLTELERGEIAQIEGALARMDRGEFGRCSQCGQAIPPKRLDVQPWARFCVACQELEEQGMLKRQGFDFDEETEGIRLGPEADDDLDFDEEEVEEVEEVEEEDEVEEPVTIDDDDDHDDDD